ncbi:MAG: ATP-binding protein [Patescibacteria group bacterium]
MDLLLILSLVIFIPVNAILAYIVYVNNPKSHTNIFFSALIFLLILYLFFNSFINTDMLSVDQKLLFSRIVIAIGAVINAAVFLFLHTFPEITSKLHKKTLWGIGIFTILLAIAGFTPLIFSDIEIVNNAVTPKPGLLMPIFLLHTLALIGGGITSLLLKYRKSQGLEKRRIRYVVLSFFILFTCIVLFNFILTVFFNFGNFVPLLPLYVLIFNALVGYAIIKIKLLEIRVFVARSVAYFIVVAISGALFSGIIFGLGQYVVDFQLSNTALLFVMGAALVLAIIFQPMKNTIAKRTDSIFFKDAYDTEAFLYRLALIMASRLHFEVLIRDVLIEVLQTMKISRGLFFLIEDRQLYSVISEEYTSVPTIDENDIDYLLHETGLVSYLETSDQKLKTILRKYQLEVLIAIEHEGEKVGMLGLGEKLSGESFSSTDEQVLSILAPEAAVAFQNAKAYEEIRRFNVTLEEEVERATKKLVTANHKLQQLDKLKDEFVSIASHELRTPMVSIKNYLWMALAGKGGKLTEKQEFYLQRSYDSSNRMTKLINDMLNISRIESGRILLHVEAVDLAELVAQIVDENKPRAKQLKIELKQAKTVTKRASNEKTDLPKVIADRDKVAEVLVNLIGNALKFTQAGGKVTISLQVDHEHVYVNVTDTGVGVEQDQIPKLFKKFGMLKESYRSYSEAAQGSGLGLYVSKSIMELHEGSLWVTSPGRDKGSTFTFTLKVYDEKEVARINKKFDQGVDAGVISTSSLKISEDANDTIKQLASEK